MALRSTKWIGTAAVLWGLTSAAHGQNGLSPSGDPGFTTAYPQSLGSQIDWSGNVEVFRFVSEGTRKEALSTEQGAPPAQASNAPSVPPAPSTSAGAAPSIGGWPSLPAMPSWRFADRRNKTAPQGTAQRGTVTQETGPQAATPQDTGPNASSPAKNGMNPVSAGTSPTQEPIQKELQDNHDAHVDESFAPTNYGTGNHRMFVQLDLLTWAVNAPDVTAIGDRASEGIVNVGGNSYYRANSLDTGFINSDWSLGGRVDLGRIEDQRGWMASVLFYRHNDALSANGVWFVPNDPDGLLAGYQDSNNDGVDDDVNNNRVHGRSGEDLGTPDTNNPGSFIAPFDGTPDQGAPTDIGDLVDWLVTFSTLTATNKVELTGFEIVDVYRPWGAGKHTFDWFYGLRYVEFREKFDVVASGGTLDTSSWNVDADNDILGPQIGLRWAANREWFRFTAEGRFLAGINFQNDRLNGGIAMNAAPGGVNGPVALEASSFNSLQNNTEFSPLGEWRVEASYYASSWLAFRIGYTGMAIGGVSRASPKLAYALPSFGLSDVGSNETVLVNGLNVGFEINR